MNPWTLSLLVFSHAVVMIAFALWSMMRSWMELFDDETGRGAVLWRLLTANLIVVAGVGFPATVLLVTFAPAGHDPMATSSALPPAILSSLVLVVGALLLYRRVAARELPAGGAVRSLSRHLATLGLALGLAEVTTGMVVLYVQQIRTVFAGQDGTALATLWNTLKLVADPAHPGATLTWYALALFGVGLASSRLRRFRPLLIAQSLILALMIGLAAYFPVLELTLTADSVRSGRMPLELSFYLLSASHFPLVLTTLLTLALLAVSAVRLYEVRTLEAIALLSAGGASLPDPEHATLEEIAAAVKGKLPDEDDRPAKRTGMEPGPPPA